VTEISTINKKNLGRNMKVTKLIGAGLLATCLALPATAGWVMQAVYSSGWGVTQAEAEQAALGKLMAEHWPVRFPSIESCSFEARFNVYQYQCTAIGGKSVYVED
jgi:hypothetical protein